MISKEFKNVAVEINSIIDNMSDALQSKIPFNFKQFFKTIACTNYEFNYDKTKKLSEQSISPKTKGVIALIYSFYLCDDNQKKEYADKYTEFLITLEKNMK